MTTQPQFLTAEKAAEMLNIHPMTLKKMARAGEIAAGKIGRKWVFVDVDLIEYIRAQYKPATAAQIETCHSTSAKIHHITGSRSSRTEELYAAALGLTTEKRRKNCTTS